MRPICELLSLSVDLKPEGGEKSKWFCYLNSSLLDSMMR